MRGLLVTAKTDIFRERMMSIDDDERAGKYDNAYNRNFYKTKDRRGRTDNSINEKGINIIDEMDKRIKEKPFIDKIFFIIEVVHNNIEYDSEKRDFIIKKAPRFNFFSKVYDYKKSAKKAYKSKKGICEGFSNTFKTICGGSGIECKIMVYNNDERKFHHQINTVFDDGKKYYVDPTWGFITDNLDELKAIYRREKRNPRTGKNIL